MKRIIVMLFFTCAVCITFRQAVLKRYDDPPAILSYVDIVEKVDNAYDSLFEKLDTLTGDWIDPFKYTIETTISIDWLKTLLINIINAFDSIRQGAFMLFGLSRYIVMFVGFVVKLLFM